MIPGYQPYYGTKENSLKSGCAFFVKEGLKFIERNDLNRKIANEGNEFQSSWIKIINDNNPNVIVGVFYRYPRKNSGDEFVENLKPTLNKIKNRNKHIIICGDFNYDLLKYEHNIYINEFLNTMSSNFLQQCLTKPTRIVKYNRPSLVDNTFVNIYDKEIHSGNIIDKITDHLPNFVIIENMINKLQKQNFKITNMKTFDKAENNSMI